MNSFCHLIFSCCRSSASRKWMKKCRNVVIGRYVWIISCSHRVRENNCHWTEIPRNEKDHCRKMTATRCRMRRKIRETKLRNIRETKLRNIQETKLQNNRETELRRRIRTMDRPRLLPDCEQWLAWARSMVRVGGLRRGMVAGRRMEWDGWRYMGLGVVRWRARCVALRRDTACRRSPGLDGAHWRGRLWARAPVRGAAQKRARDGWRARRTVGAPTRAPLGRTD